MARFVLTSQVEIYKYFFCGCSRSEFQLLINILAANLKRL